MQFLTLSYNHEQYIVEHLESIKYVVEKYAGDEKCSLTLLDDGSKDSTCDVATRWLEENGGLFSRYDVFASDENQGTVRNFLRAIEAVYDSRFKILAGDDLYANADIFSFVGKKGLSLTPVVPFYDNGKVDRRLLFDFEFQISEMVKNARKGQLRRYVKRLLLHENPIKAPGVFYDIDTLRKDGLADYIGQYRLIEDLPMWQYLLVDSTHAPGMHVGMRPYVLYRVGSGISTDAQEGVASPFAEEAERLKETVHAKAYAKDWESRASHLSYVQERRVRKFSSFATSSCYREVRKAVGNPDIYELYLELIRLRALAAS